MRIKLALFGMQIIIGISQLVSDISAREIILVSKVTEYLDLILLRIGTSRLIQSAIWRALCHLSVLTIMI